MAASSTAATETRCDPAAPLAESSRQATPSTAFCVGDGRAKRHVRRAGKRRLARLAVRAKRHVRRAGKRRLARLAVRAKCPPTLAVSLRFCRECEATNGTEIVAYGIRAAVSLRFCRECEARQTRRRSVSPGTIRVRASTVALLRLSCVVCGKDTGVPRGSKEVHRSASRTQHRRERHTCSRHGRGCTRTGGPRRTRTGGPRGTRTGGPRGSYTWRVL